MKRIIDIDDELAEKEHWYTDKEIWAVIKAVQNGTPIPDNATFGDVIEKITNRKLLEDNKDANYIIISNKLWNAPYQKGGKE